MRHDLRAIVGDGASFSFMVGAGETYVPALVLALGLGDVAAGLVATVPLLAGAVLQLISPWAVSRLGSSRAWVVSAAVVQALSLAAMAGIAWFGSSLGWWIFVAATFYWAGGLATGPVWNAWVEQLVPRSIRPHFFARRARLGHGCVLLGLATGGLLLRYGGGLWDDTLFLFVLLLGAAAGARGVSAACLASQSEPESAWPRDSLPLRHVFTRVSGVGTLRPLAMLVGMQAAVHIAGPYFTPYMLSQLGMGYVEFMILLCVSLVGKMIASPWAGVLARRVGALKLLWIGSVGIVPLSALWLVSDSFWWLFFVQVLAGLTWGVYELGMFLILFETIPRRERIAILTVYNVANAAAMVVGGLVGGALLTWFGSGTTGYLALFGLSALARGASLLLLVRFPRIRLRRIEVPASRTIAVRPSSGGIEGPILPSLEETQVPPKPIEEPAQHLSA